MRSSFFKLVFIIMLLSYDEICELYGDSTVVYYLPKKMVKNILNNTCNIC